MAENLSRSSWFGLRRNRAIVPVVRLAGTIGTGSSLRPGLSLATTNSNLERAFAKKGTPAVALAINSPGGSPVQSTLIYQRIRQLSEEKRIPVFAFCEDAAASGGYMLAIAGDEIFADKSSIVGSIGVVSANFGFVKAIEKLGVERRVHTTGRNKAILDPFQPEKHEDVERLKKLQADIHETFVGMVKQRRGTKLSSDEDDLFTGAFWTGNQALELGLIDGLGTMHAILNEKFGEKVKLRPMARISGFNLRRLIVPGVGHNADKILGTLGAGIAEDAFDAMDVRALWQRYGL